MIDLRDRPHAVYVMWADEVPVYVGMSSEWEVRLREYGVWWNDRAITKWNAVHGDSLPITHIDVWELGVNRDAARDVEREAIRALMPTHNRDNKPGEVFDKRRKPLRQAS